jgi:hypothetical protein
MGATTPAAGLRRWLGRGCAYSGRPRTLDAARLALHHPAPPLYLPAGGGWLGDSQRPGTCPNSDGCLLAAVWPGPPWGGARAAAFQLPASKVAPRRDAVRTHCSRRRFPPRGVGAGRRRAETRGACARRSTTLAPNPGRRGPCSEECSASSCLAGRVRWRDRGNEPAWWR